MAKTVHDIHRIQRERERWLIPWPTEGKHPFIVAYANSYHVGMSNLGFHRILEMLCSYSSFRPRRVFFPTGDLEKAYRRSGGTLLELDSDQPVAAARVLAFSIAFEEDYLRVPEMLKMAGLPLRARDRGAQHPLVVAGGFALSLNPEPIAEFIDLAVFGAAEEHLPELLESMIRGFDGEAFDDQRRAGWIADCGTLPGVYAPASWDPTFEDERLVNFVRKEGASGVGGMVTPQGRQDPKVEKISAYPRAVLPPSSWSGPMFSPRSTLLKYNGNAKGRPPRTICLTPGTEFADRFLILVGAGCHYGCRFCTAGYANRPPSAWPLEEVEQAIVDALEHTDRIGLIGPAVTDYPDLEHLATTIVRRGGRFSTSSLKIGPLGHEVTGLLKEGHLKGASIAPEAGSQRLRNLVNKPITQDEIVETIDNMTRDGIDRIKMYLLCGLPTETDDDIDAIIELGLACRERYREVCAQTGHSGSLTLSVNPFIPKPGTPFQWSPMVSVDRLQEIARRLRKGINRKPPLQLDFMSPRMAVMQAAISLGDRRVADLLEDIVHNDGRWWPVLKRNWAMVEDVVFREKERYEMFPWEFIDTSVSRPYLWKEWVKASRSDLTPICDVNHCVACSACMTQPPAPNTVSSKPL